MNLYPARAVAGQMEINTFWSLKILSQPGGNIFPGAVVPEFIAEAVWIAVAKFIGPA